MAVKWTIERSYPRKADRRPYSEPEQWQGWGLREFADQLEDAAGIDREETSERLDELVEELIEDQGAAAATWEYENDDDGRRVEATVEWEV